ncbi:MAG: shikimate kinase [Chitinophagaceae bacterium]|nr:shikimate kinase [Chitinophagaceae bacterium]
MTSEYQRIFLTGFMGSGKTYWGKKWADASGFQFVDVDEIVEQEQGKTIANIFAQDGEEHFRNLETNVLRRLNNRNNIIVATGGGTPCFNDNISWMNENGTAVYLQSSAENILKRLISEKEKRPLIKNLQDEELLFYITEKIKEREPFYKQAEIILNVDNLAHNYFPEFLNI